jgi:hypothetical protein
MKTVSNITSVESKATFQEMLLERFVQQNLPPRGFGFDRITGLGTFANNYKEIESCAAETPVNGTVEIFFTTLTPESTRRLSIPVCSRFFVYCTRDEEAEYKVSWSSSLS